MLLIILSGGCSELPPSKTRPHLQPRGRSKPCPAAQATTACRTGRALPVTSRVVRKAAAAWGSRPSRTEQRLGSVLPAAQSRRREHSSGSKTFVEIIQTCSCVSRFNLLIRELLKESKSIDTFRRKFLESIVQRQQLALSTFIRVDEFSKDISSRLRPSLRGCDIKNIINKFTKKKMNQCFCFAPFKSDEKSTV